MVQLWLGYLAGLSTRCHSIDKWLVLLGWVCLLSQLLLLLLHLQSGGANIKPGPSVWSLRVGGGMVSSLRGHMQGSWWPQPSQRTMPMHSLSTRWCRLG